jgi:hypothetical protein
VPPQRRHAELVRAVGQRGASRKRGAKPRYTRAQGVCASLTAPRPASRRRRAAAALLSVSASKWPAAPWPSRVLAQRSRRRRACAWCPAAAAARAAPLRTAAGRSPCVRRRRARKRRTARPSSAPRARPRVGGERGGHAAGCGVRDERARGHLEEAGQRRRRALQLGQGEPQRLARRAARRRFVGAHAPKVGRSAAGREPQLPHLACERREQRRARRAHGFGKDSARAARWPRARAARARARPSGSCCPRCVASARAATPRPRCSPPRPPSRRPPPLRRRRRPLTRSPSPSAPGGQRLQNKLPT